MEFEEYLKEKKIDPDKFRNGDSAQYDTFKRIFNQVHPESFTQQKLFLINKIRRAYRLDTMDVEKKSAPNTALRPKIKPLKPKIS